jgi:fatty acid desaturase (delta-4 desaturase)
VSIDGVIYDVKAFSNVHPGGDVLKMFGGNDCTETYKMIHHGHSSNPEHFLGKMKKVGYVTDFKPEYKFDTPFERELKAEVFKIVKRGREFGTNGWFFRAFCYVSAMVVLQFIYTYYGSTPMIAAVLGLAQALIGLNVQHDANHGAASKNPLVNGVLGYGADFIGGSKYSWLEQHWTHHSFTNNVEKDPDSFSAEPLMLFNDYPAGHPNRRWYHRYQAFFFLPLLSFYWLSSVFNPQLLDMQHAGTKGFMNWRNEYLKSKIPVSLACRAIYLMMTVVAPFYHHHWQTAVYHIWIMSTVESLALSGLFSLSHNFELVDRDPTLPHRKTGETVCWAKSQVETSSTYGSFIAGYLTGGLNHQIEHHLFPRMSSSWYPYIAPKVREICKKHGVRYVYYPWIHQNIIATFTYMHKTGGGLRHFEFEALKGKA